MPPIQQQQSSRAGLITALVISIICALGFLVWAVMESSAHTKEEQARKGLEESYKLVLPSGRLGEISTLQAAFGAPNQPVVVGAESQRRRLVGLISGNTDATGEQAETQTKAAMDAIAKSEALKDASIPKTSLTGVVLALVKKAEADQQLIAAANKAREEAIKGQQAAVAQYEQLAATHKAAAEAAAAQTAKFGTDAQAAIAEKQKQVEDFSKQVEAAKKALGDAQGQFQVDLRTAQAKLETTQKQLDQALLKLSQYRQDVKNPMVRAADARITRVAPDSICYIDLGFGEHVMPGMTFEVYDRLDGVPAIKEGTSNEDMPRGKASIEVINVGQNSSQCRIITTSAGQTVSQGDVCANLVYDRNITPLFYVYGNFDTDQNNVATQQEAENIKNLIQRWGGRVTDKLNVEVDYVVMGKEPTLPNYSKEEIADSPIAQKRMQEAIDALKAYDDVKGTASTMHIPVMNQNRFLYYTGYFDMAKR